VRTRSAAQAEGSLARVPEERILWEGSPSIWGYFAWSWLLIGTVLWFYLVAKCTQFRVTNQRICITSGVLSRSTHEIELYRVRDTSISQPFWLRLLGLSHLIVHTTDASTPSIKLLAIRDANEIKESLRLAVEAVRERKRVRTLEA
jgi:uncharacterized membrane protein YdbT with pleckstrin-like domain